MTGSAVRCSAVLLLVIGWSGLLLGCVSEKWQTYDETMKSQIGIKNKDFYVVQWGPPSKRAQLDEGGEVLTWEWQGFMVTTNAAHAPGWRKTLVFSREGLLKDQRWEHWGAPPIVPPWGYKEP
jgi:hypothetical protein